MNEKQLKKDIEQIHTKEQWITDTLNAVREYGHTESKTANTEQMKQNHRIGRKGWKVALIAATITTLSVGSVFAYTEIRRAKNNDYQWQNPQESLNVIDGAKDNGVQLETFGTSVENKDLLVELGEYKVEEHQLIASVKVSTKDGSALFDENQDKTAVLTSSGFQNLWIAVDNGEYQSMSVASDGTKASQTQSSAMMTVNTADASDPSTLYYQLTYNNNAQWLIGKNISLKLGNYGTIYQELADIHVKADNVAALIAGGKEASESDFIKNESQKGDFDMSYILQPGQNHITFSDDYAGCYIDNYGFCSNGRYEGAKAFYMTIVCDSDQAREELSRPAFQNKLTGRNEVSQWATLEDGRIQVVYQVNSDKYYTAGSASKSKVDTTVEHLQNISLKRNVSTGEFTVISEEEMEVKVQTATTESTKIVSNEEISVVSPYSGTEVKVKGITLDSMNLKIIGTMVGYNEDGHFLDKFGIQGDNGVPYIVMKDGTVVKGKKPGGGGKDGSFDMTWSMTSIIDTDQVAQIMWHDTVLYEK